MIPGEMYYMQLALEQAQAAAERGEVPVGAVVVEAKSGRILAAAGNETLARQDPTAHAEMLAMRTACQQVGAAQLNGCDLFVTLEPCPMCATAISFARIRRLYFGAYDMKSGGVDHGPRVYTHRACHHKPEVYGGLQEEASARLLTDFFSARR